MGRLITYAFEVLNRLRTTIKSHALANFLTEFTYLEEAVGEPPLPDLPPELQVSILTWVLYMNGSSNNQKSVVAVIMTTPDCPIELGLPSFRIGNFQATENNEVLRQKLDLIKEKRDQAYIQAVAYKKRASQYFNRKVKHCFQVWDLVL